MIQELKELRRLTDELDRWVEENKVLRGMTGLDHYTIYKLWLSGRMNIAQLGKAYSLAGEKIEDIIKGVVLWSDERKMKAWIRILVLHGEAL